MKDTNSINITANINSPSATTGGFILKKKAEIELQQINVKLEKKTIEELDILCDDNGYSRTELINNMVTHCLKNLILSN